MYIKYRAHIYMGVYICRCICVWAHAYMCMCAPDPTGLTEIIEIGLNRPGRLYKSLRAFGAPQKNKIKLEPPISCFLRPACLARPARSGAGRAC